MGLRDLRRRRGREGRRGPSPPPCCRPGRRGGPVIASGREETLGAGSGAPPTPWPAAASGREQGDNGRARGRGAPYPAPPPWPPPPSLKPHGRAPPLLPRSRHAAPSASSPSPAAATPSRAPSHLLFHAGRGVGLLRTAGRGSRGGQSSLLHLASAVGGRCRRARIRLSGEDADAPRSHRRRPALLLHLAPTALLLRLTHGEEPVARRRI
jgi:hypothetical protein